MKKHYLFDFDGTLVDSMPTFVSVMLRILDENNIPHPKDIVKIITPLGYHGTAKYYRSLGIDKSEEELTKTMNEYAKEEYENLYGRYKRYERFIGLSVDHGDLSCIEDDFAEIIGAAKVDDKASLITAKSRLCDRLGHIKRLSGINIDSVF